MEVEWTVYEISFMARIGTWKIKESTLTIEYPNDQKALRKKQRRKRNKLRLQCP